MSRTLQFKAGYSLIANALKSWQQFWVEPMISDSSRGHLCMHEEMTIEV